MASLRDPLPVRSITLPNRLWFPPVARDLATADGAVTDDNVEAYRKIAAGGVGTVVVEHCFVHPDGRFSAKQIGIDRDEAIAGLARIADVIRSCNAVPIAQISFAGPRTSTGRKLGPSPVPLPGESTPAEPMTEEYIGRMPSLFEAATRRALAAGFAGVEIHGAHGFLLSSFFSPLTNHRTDAYGGALQARGRLALEVVAAARRHASAQFLIGFRLGADDGQDGGLVPEDAAQLGRWLQEAGVDILSISGGLCGSRPARLSDRQGYFFPQASIVKAGVSIPVVGVGGVTDPAAARDAVARGVVDLVAVGRRLMADPDWAARALSLQ
ncbi:MAG: NADH:flavin oxidoreductase [Deltaproteobacteria bacterium]|nr:NADH:flavin oxidoreductase [Deltaproteobacteria bacterium]